MQARVLVCTAQAKVKGMQVAARQFLSGLCIKLFYGYFLLCDTRIWEMDVNGVDFDVGLGPCGIHF